eukprot:2407701-Rhodomonas_salina.2
MEQQQHRVCVVQRDQEFFAALAWIAGEAVAALLVIDVVEQQQHWACVSVFDVVEQSRWGMSVRDVASQDSASQTGHMSATDST